MKNRMLRGMEIRYIHGGLGSYFTYHIHSIFDLGYFFIDRQFIKDFPLKRILGPARFLYWPIPYPKQQGTWYYFVPVALWVKFRRLLRRIWITPLIWLHRAGYAKIEPGEQVYWFWFRYLTWTKQPQDH